jgi:hypothetical protein
VQDRSAGAIDGADRLLVERYEMLREALGFHRVKVEQAAPTPANAEHLVAFIDRAVNDGFDTGIQARDITASSQDANSLCHCIPPSALWLILEEYIKDGRWETGTFAR